MKILIDNGHGSDTKGKHSPDNPPSLREPVWARSCAARLKEALEAEGLKVIMITPEETDTPLTKRVARINEACAKYGVTNCVLVSIHNNAAGSDGKWHAARGFSVFVSKNASSKSKDLAAMFTDLAKERDLTGNRSIPTCKYWTWPLTKKADIYILSKSRCPAVLTENLFQDNFADIDFLNSEEGMQKLVELHVDALKKYVAKYDSKNGK
ncbi:MAG: N-acetylmuramoyl-L-alanine amidase [Muribaculaceae bacterium]|nr:N-acetylmuramoyl-L-alanine amidase [Muribaculaceae bacterium]